MARSVHQQIKTRTRQAKALDMRRHGSTYAEIADQLGFSGAGAAWKAVQRGIREIGQEEARVLALLQHERLTELLAETWPIATDASNPKCLQAIDTTLKIMDRMNRVSGLGT